MRRAVLAGHIKSVLNVINTLTKMERLVTIAAHIRSVFID